jgi:hypothetical protein
VQEAKMLLLVAQRIQVVVAVAADLPLVLTLAETVALELLF